MYKPSSHYNDLDSRRCLLIIFSATFRTCHIHTKTPFLTSSTAKTCLGYGYGFVWKSETEGAKAESLHKTRVQADISSSIRRFNEHDQCTLFQEVIDEGCSLTNLKIKAREIKQIMHYRQPFLGSHTLGPGKRHRSIQSLAVMHSCGHF